MGLFDWLRVKRDTVEVADDRIWLTKQAKLDGIQREIGRMLAVPNAPDALFAVAHFRDGFEECESMIEGVGFDRQRVLVNLAESLRGQQHLDIGLDESRFVQFVVAERHPLPSHDEAVVEFARMVARRIRAAQQRIENQAIGDRPARSAAGWMELNCPNDWHERSA